MDSLPDNQFLIIYGSQVRNLNPMFAVISLSLNLLHCSDDFQGVLSHRFLWKLS